jgi:hypothetical protein
VDLNDEQIAALDYVAARNAEAAAYAEDLLARPDETGMVYDYQVFKHLEGIEQVAFMQVTADLERTGMSDADVARFWRDLAPFAPDHSAPDHV